MEAGSLHDTETILKHFSMTKTHLPFTKTLSKYRIGLNFTLWKRNVCTTTGYAHGAEHY